MGRFNVTKSGGRGRGRGRGGNNGKGKNTNKKVEVKFYPHGSNGGQTYSYSTVKEEIVNLIQRTYSHGLDVATSLKNMEVIDVDKDKPTLAACTIDKTQDAAGYEAELEQNKLVFQTEYTIWKERKEKLKYNLTSAFSLIFQKYCSTSMQKRVEEHEEYESTIYNDPIELLKAIGELMHATVRAKYPYQTITDTLLRFLLCKQREKEGLLEFSKRYKQERDVMNEVSNWGRNLGQVCGNVLEVQEGKRRR